MISEAEALEIARRAAELALACRPVPSNLTLSQAAEVMGVSRPTARRMLAAAGISANVGGKYRIEDVWRARGPISGPTRGPRS
jgi:excisionase family DNA binding protein